MVRVQMRDFQRYPCPVRNLQADFHFGYRFGRRHHVLQSYKWNACSVQVSREDFIMSYVIMTLFTLIVGTVLVGISDSKGG